MRQIARILLCLVLVSCFCVPACADGFAHVEYDDAKVAARAAFIFVDINNRTLYTYEVSDASRAVNEMSVTLTPPAYVLDVQTDVNLIENLFKQDNYAKWTWRGGLCTNVTFTITVGGVLAPVTELRVSHDEALKLLYSGGVAVDEDIELTGLIFTPEGGEPEVLERDASGFFAELAGEYEQLPGTLRLTYTKESARGNVEIPFNINRQVSSRGVSGPCTVTFSVADETVAMRILEAGSALGTLPEPPAQAGASFTGWLLDGEPADEGTRIYGDAQLRASYARVTEHEGSVVYISNADGALVEAVERKCGAIDPTTLRIRLKGENGRGNEDYAGSGWTERNLYYAVANCTSEADAGAEHSNRHIPPDELLGFEAYASSNGREVSASFGPGDFELIIEDETVTLLLSPEPFASLAAGTGPAYMEGRGERIFAPGDGITRAEAVSMFYRCLTEESRESLDERGDFADVRRGSWYYDAVTLLAGAGVAEPRADGRFYPDEYITRAEFVTLAARASGLEPDYGPDRFNDVAHSPQRAYINAVAEAGIISGYPDGGFHPGDGITRAEAVKVMNALLGRSLETGRPVSPPAWQDVPADAWFTAEIALASSYFVEF